MTVGFAANLTRADSQATCESAMLSALEDKVESDGSRSRWCTLVRDPSDTLSASAEDLVDLIVLIPRFDEADRASMIDLCAVSEYLELLLHCHHQVSFLWMGFTFNILVLHKNSPFCARCCAPGALSL